MKKNFIKREKLKEFRIGKKLTQTEMAKVLEISQIQYQYIELGYRNPSFEVLEKFKKKYPESKVDEIFLSTNIT